MSDVFKLTGEVEVDHAAFEEAISAVRSGQLVVIPTDTSYAVIADAFHPGAITLLRMAKQQLPGTSIPVGVASIEMAHGVARLSNLASDLANVFWPGPLTLLTHMQSSLSWPISDNRTALSIRVPQSEIATRVLTGSGPVAMTGAQLAGQSAIQDVEQAIAALGEKVAVYLDASNTSHNLDTNLVSSVVDATTNNLRLVRQGSITLEALRNVNPNVIDATLTK